MKLFARALVWIVVAGVAFAMAALAYFAFRAAIYVTVGR